MLTDACWALSYVSDGSNDKIQAVIEAGVCQRLVELLIHSRYYYYYLHGPLESMHIFVCFYNSLLGLNAFCFSNLLCM